MRVTRLSRPASAALRAEVKAKVDRVLIADLLAGNATDTGKNETTA